MVSINLEDAKLEVMTKDGMEVIPFKDIWAGHKIFAYLSSTESYAVGVTQSALAQRR